MLWTFAAFFLLLAVLLVLFLKTVIEQLKEAYFIYPSNADIDQLLPMEIMEHVMTCLDPRSLAECRLVSKYWRHHAKNNAVQQQVLAQSDITMMEAFAALQIPATHRLQFPLDHVTLIDRATAQKHGATLLDLDAASLSRIKERFNKPGPRYFMRTRANKSYSMWHMALGYSNFKIHPVPDLDWHYTPSYSDLEFIFDVAEYIRDTKAPQQVYRCRDPAIPKYFWILPLNYKILPTMIYLFAPIIVRDILHAPSFLPIIKTWFGPAIFILALIGHALVVKDSSNRHYNGGTRSFKIVAALFFIFYATSAIFSYPHSSTHFAAVGIISLMFLYYMFLKESVWRQGQQQIYWHRFYPALIAAILILLMNDWKLTVDSIKNYAILWTLFNNTVHYGILCLNFVVANFFGSAVSELKWSYLVKWDSTVVRWLRNAYLLVILMTLYAPTWSGNHV